MLDYFEGQDVDIFCYDKQSFIELLYFMKYNSLFQLLDPLEKHKFNDFIKNDRSSLKSIGLITVKFKYNLCVDANVTFKERQSNIFSVLSNFDMDIIAQGYDIKTGKTLNLRESTGMVGTWNRWNPAFFKGDQWSCKRILRQFSRIVKYTERNYDLSSVTTKYISLVEENINKDNFYRTEKGTKFFEDTKEQFTVVLKILKEWEKTLKMNPADLLILQTLI